MKITSSARNAAEMDLLREHGAHEVLLGLSQLSRFGTLDLKTLHEMAIKAKSLELRPILEWDVLMVDTHLQQAIEILKKIDLTSFDAIRVQDSGALAVVKKLKPRLAIQLILETGNHNLEGVRRWCEAAGNDLERVVLSIELTGKTLARYVKNIPVSVEVLGLGPVLLFYTPRHLLSYQRNDLSWISTDEKIQNQRLEAVANAEEGFHKGFRLIENQHGTFMFHSKDYCLIDRLDQMVNMGIETMRIDLRMNQDWKMLPELSFLLKQANEGRFTADMAHSFIQGYPQKVTRCFFQTNATDVLFKKLSNEKIVRRDENFVGEVVESAKGNYTLIHVQGRNAKLQCGETYRVTTPEGMTRDLTISRMSDLDLRDIKVAEKDEYVVIPYQKLITPKTMIYQQVRDPSAGIHDCM